MSKIIANRYHIETEIGEGGMGTVYRGIDIQTAQNVAIKQLKPEIAQTELIERFKREGEMLRDLNHPNIVKMLDTVEQDDLYYLVMEYVSGGDLQNLLSQQNQLPTEHCLKLALDLSDALTRAHHLDIIHRDMKPANVLIAEDGTPRLTDFGVALMADKERVTGANVIVGTIDYLAPEMFQDGYIDKRSDIWSFGIMLFEMLTGKKPFKGGSMAQLIYQIVSGEIPDLEDARPDAPINLVDLIYRMLEKDPNQRVSSVRAIGADLEAILQGRDALVLPTTRFPKPIEVIERAKHNLPIQATTFIGRESELSELAKLLHDPQIRLVTILAPGGMGKSRLSLEAAEQQIDNFEDGVYLVELAPLNDPANIIASLADVIGYQFQADGREQKQQILDFLANKTMLLVMDNCEHLLEGIGLVRELLHTAPNLRILTTSRQRLNQTGETVFNLAGMDFLEWETPDDALEYAAFRLFMQIAKRMQPQFEANTDNIKEIARICKLVQGMPLGILLAASWLGMLSVEEIAVEIAQGIDFLESDMSDLPERHRSIRAVFDYSWDLMSEIERDAFMKLSVFRGGFTREAAQLIAGANLRTLMNLMKKSLIRRDADSGFYEVHGLLRQYGEAQLEHEGIEAKIRDTHAQYYLNLLAKREQDLRGRNQLAALHEIYKNFENIRTAWQAAINHGQNNILSEALDSLFLFSSYRSSAEGMSLLEQAELKFRQVNPEGLSGRLIVRIGMLRSKDGLPIEEAMRKAIYKALQDAENRHDEIEIAFCQTTILYILLMTDHQYQQALSGFEHWLSAYEKIGDIAMQSWLLHRIALCYALIGDMDNHVLYSQKSMDIAQLNGNFAESAHAMSNIVWFLLLHTGDIKKAVDYQKQAMFTLEELNQIVRVAHAKNLLSLAAFFEGDFKTAHSIADDAAQTTQEFANNNTLTHTRADQALASYGLGQYEQGKNYGLAVSFEYTTFLAQYLLHWSLALNLIALDDFATAHFHLTKALHITPQRSQRAKFVLHLIPAFAMLISKNRNHQRASQLLNLAYEHPIAHQGWQNSAPFIIQFRDNLQSKLGEESYKIAYECGKSLDLETVVQELLAEFGEDEA